MVQNNLTEIFCTKTFYHVAEFEPVVMMKILSFNQQTFPISVSLSKYVFTVDKSILYGMLLINVPQQRIVPYFNYVKKNETSETGFHSLIEKMQKYYNYSSNDIKQQMQIFMQLFKNKNILYDYCKFFGIEKNEYKKYGIEFGGQKNNSKLFFT